MQNFLFDFDSTLADTRHVAVIATQQAYKLQGLTVPTPEAVISYMGIPIEVSFAKMAQEPLDESALETLYTVFRAQYQQAEQQGMAPFNGMATTLAQLKTRGNRLFVVSSKHSVALKRNLDQLELGAFFEAVSGSDLVDHYKPAPDGILDLLTRFDLDPKTSLMIGDAKYDIQMGTNAGIATAGAMWGAADPDSVKAESPTYILATPADLLTI
ncbi:putative phosphatase [Lactobacillus brevis ATCC 367] [Lactiplantibacillus mudanjiangensis]|uniref:HAD family hydrolase n=1 Tax=Lactiplantibacillus mudanjiangensis TaxID=1296538 RepID=UPI001014BE14|nr:putative phosphatase [Lactobacillus brevis ATCC 367] [Lactiplantibacillus mudanjiangensis]